MHPSHTERTKDNHALVVGEDAMVERLVRERLLQRRQVRRGKIDTRGNRAKGRLVILGVDDGLNLFRLRGGGSSGGRGKADGRSCSDEKKERDESIK